MRAASISWIVSFLREPVVLAELDAGRPGPVATRDIERVLEKAGDTPVYGLNLRGSCRRMEAAGWLRTLRAPNLQLAVELTDSGQAIAAPLLAAERERDDRPMELDNLWHMACRGDYVIRLNGTTCLQLWSAAGQVTRLEGDPLAGSGVVTGLSRCRH